MPLVDVKFFVTAVMLQRETGGNLAEILDNLVLRHPRALQDSTAGARLHRAGTPHHGPPDGDAADHSRCALVLNPEFIQPLFADPIGHTLLVAGITLQTIGYFVIRKIIKIQV